MKAKVKVTQELLKLAEHNGVHISTKRSDFYYFPFWLEVNEHGTFVYRFDELPLELKLIILEQRKNEDLQINGTEESITAREPVS